MRQNTQAPKPNTKNLKDCTCFWPSNLYNGLGIYDPLGSFCSGGVNILIYREIETGRVICNIN